MNGIVASREFGLVWRLIVAEAVVLAAKLAVVGGLAAQSAAADATATIGREAVHDACNAGLIGLCLP